MKIILAAIYPYAFLLLFLIIPFDDHIRVLPNILFVILVVAFPFTVKKEDFNKLKNPSFLIFSILFLYLVLNAALSGTIEADWKVINKVGLAIGLVLLYIPIENFDKIEKAIIFSSLAAILFTVYNFVLITDATGSFALGDSPQVLEALLIDRLYLGLLSVFSILISCKYITKKFNTYNSYYAANVVINIAFVLVMASKIAAMLLLLALLLRLFYKAGLAEKCVIFTISILASIGLFFIYSQNDRVQNEEHKGLVKSSVTWELRKTVWECAQKVANNEDFTFTGFGFAESKNKLVACYETIVNPEKRKTFVDNRYNTHNQFLDFYLGAGIIALALFVSFILLNFFVSKNSYFKVAMLGTLFFYCLFEDVFQRQIGAYYIGFILIVLIINPINVQKMGIEGNE